MVVYAPSDPSVGKRWLLTKAMERKEDVSTECTDNTNGQAHKKMGTSPVPRVQLPWAHDLVSPRYAKPQPSDSSGKVAEQNGDSEGCILHNGDHTSMTLRVYVDNGHISEVVGISKGRTGPVASEVLSDPLCKRVALDTSGVAEISDSVNEMKDEKRGDAPTPSPFCTQLCTAYPLITCAAVTMHRDGMGDEIRAPRNEGLIPSDVVGYCTAANKDEQTGDASADLWAWMRTSLEICRKDEMPEERAPKLTSMSEKEKKNMTCDAPSDFHSLTAPAPVVKRKGLEAKELEMRCEISYASALPPTNGVSDVLTHVDEKNGDVASNIRPRPSKLEELRVCCEKIRALAGNLADVAGTHTIENSKPIDLITSSITQEGSMPGCCADPLVLNTLATAAVVPQDLGSENNGKLCEDVHTLTRVLEGLWDEKTH